ncbi:hypothetical protein [Streptomyces sp. NPDC086787]|uniref:hypothetical protein n=1 Tax=Streptomyces sp. NPDC086787 TaxID=3365759 RepID=UPI0037F6090B
MLSRLRSRRGVSAVLAGSLLPAVLLAAAHADSSSPGHTRAADSGSLLLAGVLARADGAQDAAEGVLRTYVQNTSVIQFPPPTGASTVQLQITLYVPGTAQVTAAQGATCAVKLPGVRDAIWVCSRPTGSLAAGDLVLLATVRDSHYSWGSIEGPFDAGTSAARMGMANAQTAGGPQQDANGLDFALARAVPATDVEGVQSLEGIAVGFGRTRSGSHG